MSDDCEIVDRRRKNILEFLKSSVRAYIRTHPVGVDDSQGTSYASLIDPSRSALAMCAYPCVGASIARPQQGPPITQRRCKSVPGWVLRICIGVVLSPDPAIFGELQQKFIPICRRILKNCSEIFREFPKNCSEISGEFLKIARKICRQFLKNVRTILRQFLKTARTFLRKFVKCICKFYCNFRVKVQMKRKIAAQISRKFTWNFQAILYIRIRKRKKEIRMRERFQKKGPAGRCCAARQGALRAAPAQAWDLPTGG